MSQFKEMKDITKRYKKSNNFLKKAARLIPLASQTFSKSHLIYTKGAAPLFITHARGARAWDVDGNEYIDFESALLPIILGYQYPAVDRAIEKQLKKGIIFSQPSPLEYALAQLLIKHIPSAEMVRFGKNGSDATTGAIRLARATTGRDHIAICAGHYHGWHDWYIGSTTRDLGVPRSAKDLTHKFKYNHLASLEKIFKKYPRKIAAVIMEPMNTEEPRDNFLQQVRSLTHKYGALLIFDEMITGFRFSLGGAQKYFGVTPDLSAFGKAMGNGMPISALVGKRKCMKKVEDIFYSFTAGGETLSIAAAIATIKELEKKKALRKIRKLGRYLQTNLNKLISEFGLEKTFKLGGKPCWTVLVTSKTGNYTPNIINTYIQQEMFRSGIFWESGHNLSFSHTRGDVDRLLSVYRKLFKNLVRLIEKKRLKQAIEGEIIKDIFRVRRR